MENYKNEIEQTRRGSLGGSDANLLSQVASLGYVPQSAKKRLAIMKGLIENENITTRVMLFGDFIEQEIFKNISEGEEGWQSNPLWVSGKYSKDGVRLICHADYAFYDEKNKILKVYECKATRFDVRQTRNNYENQLFIEWTLAKEIVKARGEGWKVQMFLCHYNTDGVDIDQEFQFDPARLSIHRLRMQDNLFDIDKAMTIISEFAATFDYYTEDEEVEAEYLPEKVKKEFNDITSILVEIKEREARVDDFKRRLCEFMEAQGIKCIKSDFWGITYVAATESVSFDSKKFLADYATKHPKLAKKLKKDYEKRTARGSYVTIKVKTNKEK